MSLPEILKEKQLPLVVEVSHEDVVAACRVTGFSLHQPLLLFREVLIPKVFARNVVWEQTKGQRARFKEVGPYVVIPSDYTGNAPVERDNHIIYRLTIYNIISSTSTTNNL